jgi:hypothetical protein
LCIVLLISFQAETEDGEDGGSSKLTEAQRQRQLAEVRRAS